MDWFKPPRGHEEVRASFPNQIHKSSHTNNIQIYPKEMNWGRGTQGRRPGETENSRTQYKSRSWPNTSEGVFIPAGPVRPVRWLLFASTIKKPHLKCVWGRQNEQAKIPAHNFLRFNKQTPPKWEADRSTNKLGCHVQIYWRGTPYTSMR